MTEIYKVIAVILTYPEHDWVSQIDGIRTRLTTENGAMVRALEPLLAYLAERPLIELQEAYVQTFDQTTDHALYLFHHLLGDSPDRGHAMSNLVDTYRRHAIEPTDTELPDFLPRYLEFLSLLQGHALRQAAERLRPVVEVLFNRLSRAHSPYAAAFEALTAVMASPQGSSALASVPLFQHLTKRLRT